jgi:D-serine deaminase-like pyridoxal phosphate-dependent protein
MMRKAEASGVRFRPHFKTHQSAEVGEWFKQVGVDSITVSSVDMATYFSANGWEDITIAFSVNIRAIERIDELAAKISLGLLAESDEMVEFLNKNLKHRVDLWVDVDVTYRRTGTDSHDTCKVLSLAEKTKHSEVLSFAGVLTHAGAFLRSEVRR